MGKSIVVARLKQIEKRQINMIKTIIRLSIVQYVISKGNTVAQ